MGKAAVKLGAALTTAGVHLSVFQQRLLLTSKEFCLTFNQEPSSPGTAARTSTLLSPPFASSSLCNRALNNLGSIASAFRGCWCVCVWKGCNCQRQLNWIIPGSELLALFIYLDSSLPSPPPPFFSLHCMGTARPHGNARKGNHHLTAPRGVRVPPGSQKDAHSPHGPTVGQ